MVPRLSIIALCLSLVGCRSAREESAWQELREVEQAIRASSRVSQPAPLPVDADLDAYLALALQHSPDLKRAYEEWQAALLQAPQVFSLPDPTISFGVYAQEVETRVGAQRFRLGIRQKIPWLPRLVEARDLALAAAEVAEARFTARKFRLFEKVSHAYARYAYNGRALDRTREILELLIQLEAVAQARLHTQAGQADLIRVQVEIGKVEDHVASFEDRRSALSTGLRAAIGLAGVGTLLPEPRQIPALVPPHDSLVALASRLAENNPELALVSQKIAKAAQAEELATEGWYPDLTVGVDWIETDGARNHGVDDSGKDPVMFSLGLNLPIFTGRTQARIDQARAEQRAASWELADTRLLLEAELSQAVFEWRDAQRRLSLYGDTLIPKQSQSLIVTQTAYESGDLEFLSVIEAERTLLEFQLQLERSRADTLRALATLERLLGERFTLAEKP